MNLIIKKVPYNHPDFVMLTEILNQELWDRNPGRQSEYVSHNYLDSEANTVVAYEETIPVACGAFRGLENDEVEIKRMFVKPEYRGKGFGNQVLKELENWAQTKNSKTAILETGLNHLESISLYKKSGYIQIENYGPYKNLPQSVCMKKVF